MALLLHTISRLIFHILHYLYSVCEKCEEYYEQFVYFVTRRRKPLNFKHLEQVPKHLTVILGGEASRFDSLDELQTLANLIMWCLACRIPFISFHDYKGHLRKNRKKLEALVERQRRELDWIAWRPEKNGFLYKRKVNVKILSDEPNLTMPALCLSVHRNVAAASVDRLTCDDFRDDFIRKSYDFPDPDVALCVGATTLQIHRYTPCWVLRITELYHHRNLAAFSFYHFAKILEKFSKVEQRLGK